MRLLITGGAGFIASHLAAYFEERPTYQVHVADRLSYAGKARNIPKFINSVRFWYGDLKDADFCEKLSNYGFDAIIHCAANTHVDRSIAYPIEFSLDNVVGTNQLLNAFSHNKPSRIIVYSTDEVYGPTPQGERFDESAPFKPSNAYSASKVGVEGLASAYWITYRLPIIVVRPCNTYGRRQHPEKAIPKFIGQALKGEPLTVHNDGQGSRDWLHTSDHAAAIECLLEKSRPGEAYNLAAGDEHTDDEIAHLVIQAVGSQSSIKYIQGRPGHDRRYWMNPAKLSALGWRPRMPFAEGFADAVKWTMTNQDWWAHDYIEVKR